MSTSVSRAVHVNQDDYVISSSESSSANTANNNNNIYVHVKQSKNRKRFDSSSTNSSSLESCQFDTRFEAKPIYDVPQIKKSFLSSSESAKTSPQKQQSQLTPPQSAATKPFCSALTSSQSAFASTATTQYASVSAETFSIHLCIASPNERDAYNNYIFRCFPAIEMVLDDDKPVDSLIYEITGQLNEKLHANLLARYPSLSIPMNNLLKINGSSMLRGDFELSEASKSGQPKGCSFDQNQQLRKIKCKSRLCLKVFSESAYDTVLLQLLKKQTNKYGQGVNPIIEIEDDSVSVARAASLYKDSLMQREMDSHRGSMVFNKIPQKCSFYGKENLNQISGSPADNNSRSAASEKKNADLKVKQKKPSFWSRIFNCSHTEIV